MAHGSVHGQLLQSRAAGQRDLADESRFGRGEQEVERREEPEERKCPGPAPGTAPGTALSTRLRPLTAPLATQELIPE